MAHDAQARWDVLQDFADVFTQTLPRATAIGARWRLGQMLLDVARQVLGHRPTRRRGTRRRCDRFGFLRALALVDVQLFEFKLELIDLTQQFRSEEHTSELPSLMR